MIGAGVRRRSLVAGAHRVLLARSLRSTPAPATAQSAKLEAAYVVVGGEGAVARAILSDTAECPAITIGTSPGPMRVRAKPDSGDKAAFPILVCEAPIPSDATSAAIEGRALPLPKPTLSAVAALGDTGCRLKAAKTQVQGDHDYHPAGQFQDCDLQSKWPFSRLSHTVGRASPTWSSTSATTSIARAPARKATRAARAALMATTGRPGRPISLRRRRRCSPPRRGSRPAATTKSASAPAPATSASRRQLGAGRYAARLHRSRRALYGEYRRQVLHRDGFQPTPGIRARTTPVTAHPMRRCSPVSAGARQRVRQPPPDLGDRTELHAHPHAPAGAERVGRQATDGIDLALAGHMHMWELLTFTDQRSPQLIVGTWSTALDPKIERSLAGMKVGGATVRFGRAERDWGFTMLMPGQGGTGWTATFVTLKGKAKFACRIERAQASCGRRAIAGR